MFDKKYKKALEILDSEIAKAQYSFNSLADFRNFERNDKAKVSDEYTLRILQLMNKYQNKLYALYGLKHRLLKELGG